MICYSVVAKLFLPIEVSNTQCAVVVSDGHIRVYDKIPNGTTQNNVRYWDFYVRENYLQTTSTTNYSSYTSYQCMDNTQFTTDFWYRPDIWQSLLCFVIIGGIGIYLPYKIISRLFGKWLKV